MTQQFFYAFSEGEYSDYGVNGLYVSDHEVPKGEWDAHYKAYQDEVSRLTLLIPMKEETFMSGRVYQTRDYDSPEGKAYTAYKEANDPEKTFIAMHNMQKVEYTELWRDR